MRHISESGLAMLKGFEGLRLTAYPDPGTGDKPWTLGYGHTAGVHPGDTCTEQEADQWLREDVAWAERCVERAIEPVESVTDNEFDAMVSLTFNIGCASFQRSTVLRLILDGSENDDLFRHAFKLWNRSGGHEMAGLTARRLKEAEHFIT